MALYTLAMWFALLILPFLFLALLLRKRNTKLVLPPSPPKLPLLGNLLQLGPLPHISFRSLSNKYGPVMLLRLGRLSTVVISSADAARVVLKDHDLDCCSRPFLVGPGRLSYNCSDISFSPYGDYWRELRKLSVVELFNLKRVQSYRFIREEEVSSMIDSISQSSNSGTTPVNLTEKLFSLTANNIFRMAFGKKSDEESGYKNNHGFEEIVREAMAVFGSFAASEFFPCVGWIFDRLTGLHQRFEKVFHELDALYEQVLADHLNPGRTIRDGHEDIVDVLVRVQRDGIRFGEAPLSNDSIKAVIMDLFIAGADTTAATVNWAMAELVRNPRVMKKTQDEVRAIAGKNGLISEDEIDQLKYLKMEVKETLRLHPPAALLLPRETMSHFRINGFDILPKMLIQVNVWAIGRDPKYWKDPEDFFPERFCDSSIDFKGQNCELLPFGGGRRSCPGIYLGTRMIELTLANLLNRFDWEMPFGMKSEDIDMEEVSGLTISKKTPLQLVPIDRVLIK